jgi:hypothetical protein
MQGRTNKLSKLPDADPRSLISSRQPEYMVSRDLKGENVPISEVDGLCGCTSSTLSSLLRPDSPTNSTTSYYLSHIPDCYPLPTLQVDPLETHTRFVWGTERLPHQGGCSVITLEWDLRLGEIVCLLKSRIPLGLSQRTVYFRLTISLLPYVDFVRLLSMSSQTLKYTTAQALRNIRTGLLGHDFPPLSFISSTFCVR